MNILGVLPHPEFGPWHLGPLEIHSFGVVLAVGLLVGVIAASYRGARTIAVSEERYQNFAIWVIVFGFVFSHLFEVITYQPDVFVDFFRTVFISPADAIDIWPLGTISSLGGVLGGCIAVLIWMYRNPSADHLAWANLTAWTLPICFFFGRVGCALAFDHPGHEAEEFGLWNWIYDATGGAVPELFPLAMQFPEQWGGGIRHNLGFYEAILWFGILVFFFILSRKPRRRGLYLWLLPLLYTPGRFLLDFLRAHPEAVEFGGDPRYLGLTPAQYMSIVFFAVGIYGWSKLKDEPVEEWEEYDPDREFTSED